MNLALTNAVVVGSRLEPFVAVAGVGAGQVLAGAVAAHGPRPRALVDVAAHVVAEGVAGLAVASDERSV